MSAEISEVTPEVPHDWILFQYPNQRNPDTTAKAIVTDSSWSMDTVAVAYPTSPISGNVRTPPNEDPARVVLCSSRSSPSRNARNNTSPILTPSGGSA